MSEKDEDTRPSDGIGPEHVVRVRLGHGANCSSIGSVVDALFATATVGAAVLAAVVAALSAEPVRTAPTPRPSPEPPRPEKPSP